jgi:hypothetical protein
MDPLIKRIEAGSIPEKPEMLFTKIFAKIF